MADTRKESTTSTSSTSPTNDQGFAGPAVPGQTVAAPTVAGPSSPTTATNPLSPTIAQDRRGSDEWDASKVPPSRFQKRKGSIYAVPNSRDGKIDSNYAAKYYQKLAELGYAGHGHGHGHRKESH